MRADTLDAQVPWKYLGGVFFYGELATDPSEMGGKEYKIVEPEKKAVKKWLWFCHYSNGVFLSGEYCATEDEVRKSIGGNPLKLEKALWSEIEVDE